MKKPVLTLETVKQLAFACGFDEVGVTDATRFEEMIPVLQGYADRGLTGFEASDVEDRIDPKRWFAPTESIISVALAYLTSEGRIHAKKHPRQSGHGLITVYSFGEDYHRVMQRKLAELHAKIEAHLGRTIQAKSSTDTSPLVDRRIAERAGIGWVGHNCMFYTRQHGSFVFLGALLIDEKIEVTEPPVVQASKCATCTLCLEACPTGALIAPGVIQATRCLSYITQMKGIIPEEFRIPLGRRVWGCDICQWACPENSARMDAEHSEFLPNGELEYPDLVEILHWSQRTFNKRYGHTAAAWRGVRTWQRNALIALGNTRQNAVVPEIIPFLTHSRPELRASAAWALKRIGHPDGKAATSTAYSKEQVEEVRAEMHWALSSEN